MRREEFHQLRIGDIIEWGFDHDCYILMIKEPNVGPSHAPHHLAIVLSYTGNDPHHWKNGAVARIFEAHHRITIKVG